jgi:hypothetical protein
MHSPGVCGIVLATGSQVGTGDAQRKTKSEAVCELIDALNADTEMVLVAVRTADADTLEPVVWARAAYMVRLAESATAAEALRAMLQEVLNRGRDAALVASLESLAQADQVLTVETVHRMVAAYCEAGDEIWAVVPEANMLQGHPVLMGRRMIELFLRGQKWSAADEILSANLEHVRTVKAIDPLATVVSSSPAWKAPWD